MGKLSELLGLLITGAQPKAGTGLKMQTVSVRVSVSWFLSFFQRYIVRDTSLTKIYRWLIEIL